MPRRNVIQIVDYSKVMKISARAFDMVRRSINPKIFDYIRQNYQIAPRTMGVHLRLGQPTDDFVPTSPNWEQIVQFHKEYSPSQVILFTDNPGAADGIMRQTGLTYRCVNDTNYIECMLLSMCEYAIISESTFAVSACRLGNLKNVRLPNLNSGFKQDDSWTTF